MPAFRLPSAVVLAARMIILAAAGLTGPSQAAAAENLRVLAAGAVQGALLQLQDDIEVATGAKLDAAFDTVGALRDRVLAGESADLVVLSEAAVTALEKAGKVSGAKVAHIGIITVALAVRKGAAIPDISTPAALKQTLLSVRSIAQADPARGATAGTHFARVLGELGIASEIKDRITVMPFGVEAVAGVAEGRFEMAVSQSSEIVANPGVALAGPLPAPYAYRTRYLAVQVGADQPRVTAAIAFLQTPAARSVFARFGFTPDP
jgi:molybdate transport system substrate-binding protein